MYPAKEGDISIQRRSASGLTGTFHKVAFVYQHDGKGWVEKNKFWTYADACEFAKTLNDKTCPDCGGSGQTNDGLFYECRRCEGVGVIYHKCQEVR